MFVGLLFTCIVTSFNVRAACLGLRKSWQGLSLKSLAVGITHTLQLLFLWQGIPPLHATTAELLATRFPLQTPWNGISKF